MNVFFFCSDVGCDMHVYFGMILFFGLFHLIFMAQQKIVVPVRLMRITSNFDLMYQIKLILRRCKEPYLKCTRKVEWKQNKSKRMKDRAGAANRRNSSDNDNVMFILFMSNDKKFVEL